MTRNRGRTFSIYNVAECVGIPHTKTLENIQSTFKKTGICPYDCHIFAEIDFLPSKVTDRPNTTIEEQLLSSSKIQVEANQQQIFVSPKEFHGIPKAEDRKTNRKSRKKV